MKVQDVMTRSPTTCVLQDSLQAVAQRLWERDCGCLPVVDPDGRALAMITDRDVCMAAWSTGQPLQDLQVGAAMSKELFSCRAQEEIGAAAARMAKHGVRRMPVLDGNGTVVGIVSLNDLALAAAKEPQSRGGNTGETMRVLTAVSAHRTPESAVATASPTPSPSPNAMAPANTTLLPSIPPVTMPSPALGAKPAATPAGNTTA
jgi:CBS-domain-containing membrane protein